EQQQQRLVAKDIDQARYTAARLVERPPRAATQEGRPRIPGHAQAVDEVQADLLLVEAVQVVLEGNPLPDGAHRFRRKAPVELRLAEEDNLQQFALLGLEVGHQSNRLERLER